ncbi:UBX domain-containing protein 2B [Papilio xuthus]|uniref:UBX domain-containing protein 2B n=1 Tax=Papilio xuthus TaxID=66420 RepID=A0A0N1I544_PAPXU|nr:UBX domain-containing protein 2B [Papilio xuthus]
MSVNKEDTLRQFCDVTGADDARSRFFLESSNWQLEVALSSFYEHGGNIDEAPANPAPAAALPIMSDSDMESPPASPVLPVKKDKKKQPPTKFATLQSLQQDSSSDEEEEIHGNCSDCKKEIEELKKKIEALKLENTKLKNEIQNLKESSVDTNETGEAFYAGGSERSGQQILGPGKGRKDIVSEMFRSVRAQGAVVFDNEPTSSSRGHGVFSGVGYRLGQTADDHEQIAPPNREQEQQSRSVRLRLYREGFTVNDGPIRLYNEPENAQFLNHIRRGSWVQNPPCTNVFFDFRFTYIQLSDVLTVNENIVMLHISGKKYKDMCEVNPHLASVVDYGLITLNLGEIPTELSREGGSVRVSLEDHRHEESPHEANTRVFSGQGYLLGSPTPTTVGATVPVAASPKDQEANQRAAQEAVALDDSNPVTTLQFRLADGSRLTGRFNHSHTVGDLQQYIARAMPIYQNRQFVLLTTFPSVELTDPAVTLGQANLLNTTLLQRLK